MPDLVLKCGSCGQVADERRVVGGFRHMAFVGLCPNCVAAVQEAGPWKSRRAAALDERVRTLLERHPQLVREHAPSGKRVVMSGKIGDREVRFTLKIASRQYDDERYVFRVALHGERENGPLDPATVVFPEGFAPSMSRGSPCVVRDDHRWLRVAFLHLGRTDTLTVVDSMLVAAATLDAG